MKIKAKLEVEFEFETADTRYGDIQRQGILFLQTHLHRAEKGRQCNIKRYDIEMIEEAIFRTAYYVYHLEGYYKDADGKYDIVDNFGKHTLQWCIDYMNQCRASGSSKLPPVKVLKVKKWQTGRAEWVKIF